MIRYVFFGSAAICFAMLLAGRANACPFCAAQSLTFSQEMDAADVAVLARRAAPVGNLVEVDGEGIAADGRPSQAPFEVIKVLKGTKFIQPGQFFDTVYIGEGNDDRTFLITGVEPPVISWSTPIVLSEAAVEYVSRLPQLNDAKPVDRLRFFADYLEHEDEMLAQDAYDEFALAPFDVVKKLEPDMNHDALVGWIKDPKVPASRRSLYLTMLGVCGTQDDLPMLESIMTATDRQKKAGLNAAINCYIMIKGASGLEKVEELFLKNEDADYTDTYSAVVALRVHGQEVKSIPQKRLVEGLRHMLDRPELADLVIPDLARWQDWESTDRLVQLFKEADGDSTWARAPIINFLQASPEPRADQLLAELKKIDPKAYERANAFAIPVATTAPPPAEDDEPLEAEVKLPSRTVQVPADEENAAVAASADQPSGDADVRNQEAPSSVNTVVAASEGDEASAAVAEPDLPLTRWVVAVPVLSVVVLMGVIWVILRSPGGGARA